MTHNIRIRGASTPLKSAITKALSYNNPVYVDRKKKRRPTWGIDPKIKLYVMEQGDIIAPRGFLKELQKILKGLKIDPSVIKIRHTEGQAVDFGPWNTKYIPKEDQVPAIEAITKDNGILVAPAGSGKTLMGMRYIHDKGRPAIWLTHTTDLMYQSKKNAEKYLHGVGNVGILGDSKKDWGDGKLIVATVQTLEKNPQYLDALKDIIGTIVIDEAHHFPAPMFIEVAGRLPAANIIGLTATPERKDGLEFYLYNGVGPIAYQIKRDGLYEAGRLIKPDIKFVYTGFRFEQASDRNAINSVDAGGEDLDYRELLNRLIADEPRTELIARSIIDHAPNNHAIVITESVRYCYALKEAIERIYQEQMQTELPNMAVVHSTLSRYSWRAAKNEHDARRRVDTGQAVEYKRTKQGWRVKVENYTEEEFKAWQITKQKRKDILEAASNKQIDILFATQLAREGLDMPHLTIGHMAMPKRGDAQNSKNGAAVEQEIGRIMRPDPDSPNKKAVWFDYVDYNVGVFQSQYYSRRKVYKRLGLKVPKKPRNDTEDALDFIARTMDFPM